jgi:hypothetical protein
MATENETTADPIAWLRRPREGENGYLTLWRDEIADRLEAALKRERVLAVSIMRSELYGIAGGLRAIAARSDARQRGIHYTEVQNIAAQIENIADNGGEA